MKRIIKSIAILSILVLGGACSNDLDNYAEPDATLQGTVINVNTGKPLETEVGDRGIRIKLLETSWSATPTPQYLYTHQDGTFINKKIFAATYNVVPEGAFVPLVQAGATPVDKSQTVTVGSGGTATVDFQVEPLLEVKYEGEPILNADGTITVKFRVTRGTTNPSYQPNMDAVFLFINNTKYLGDNNWDSRYSRAIVYSGTAGNALLGTVISITTNGGALPKGRDYYVRVGARTVFGLNLYNYCEPKVVTVPN